MTLTTRRPTGAVPWPVVLLEGPEKCGKSWAAAVLSASDKVGATYWIDLNEGADDEYGAIPGVRYEIVVHDGSFRQLVEKVEEIRAVAAKAAEAQEPPVVLVVDSMTAEWDLLKEWAHQRAKGSQANQKLLRSDPLAEINISMNYWNDATARHRRLMTLLLTFPGIVVLTARGKETAAVDDSGKPVNNGKDYRVEGNKNLAFDATVWVRMSRDHGPMIVGARSVHHGVRPGIDQPKPTKDFSVEWLVFDVLKCDPTKAHVRDLPTGDLTKAKAEVWALAQQLGWTKEDLAADYAKHHEDAKLSAATVEQLQSYAEDLLREVEGAAKQDTAGGGA